MSTSERHWRVSAADGPYATLEYDDRTGGVCLTQGSRLHYTSVRCIDEIEIRRPSSQGQLWRFLIFRHYEAVMDVPFHGDKAPEFYDLAFKIRRSRWTISPIGLTTPSPPSDSR